MSGHIITRGLGGRTLVTRGYGVSSWTAFITREMLKLFSYIKTTLNIESRLWQ